MLELCDFSTLPLSEPIRKAIADLGWTQPTPVQEQALPLALSGCDVIAQAQTGTGKTAVFAIPLVELAAAERLKHPESRLPVALVLVPTRELALQVAEETSLIGKYHKIKAEPIYGGVSLERQIQELRNGVALVVGTPGRIKDHLGRGTLSLKGLKAMVLDEADAMLDMGFIDDVEDILREVPRDRQTMLFSATISDPIARIADRHMRDPKRVQVDPTRPCAEGVRQLFYNVGQLQRSRVLIYLVRAMTDGLTLVFCQTKREVDLVTRALTQQGIQANAIHGDFSQAKREQILARFREGKFPVLVATDLAARGIHIGEVNQVINYSVPEDPERYVHRIGRTGRAGKEGVAVTFVSAHDLLHLRAIERVSKIKITLVWPPDSSPASTPLASASS